MSTTMILVFIAVVVLVFSYVVSQRQPENFPPGPWGFPILGHLPLLSAQPHKKLAEWRHKYGPIIGINFGSFRCIVINDFKLIKDSMSQHVFSGRPKIQICGDLSVGRTPGIIFTDGHVWQEQRRFTHRHLRDFGFGTKSMESIVQDEIKELIQGLKSEVGSTIQTRNRFNVAVVNVLWGIIAGERFKQDDPELNKIIKLLTSSFDEVNFFVLLSNFVPALARFAPNFMTGYAEVLEPINRIHEFIQAYVDHHFNTHTDGQPPRDFLDTYIDEMKRTTDPESSFHIHKKWPELMTLLDLFVAGTETTSTTLSWIFLYMAKFPEAQVKLADEISRVVGNDRMPSLEDRKQMPYTEAVIHEVLRCKTIIPLAFLHSTLDQTHLHGYDIPKDTMVIINLYEAHNNVEFWGDPAEFRPERFLSPDGAEFKKQEAFLPFGTGKRVCLGEALARDELFLFTTSLFQVFKIGVDPSNPNPTLEPNMGGVLMPQKHHLSLEIRE